MLFGIKNFVLCSSLFRKYRTGHYAFENKTSPKKLNVMDDSM